MLSLWKRMQTKRTQAEHCPVVPSIAIPSVRKSRFHTHPAKHHKMKLGPVLCLNGLLLHLQAPATHVGAGSCPGCFTSYPVPWVWPGKVVGDSQAIGSSPGKDRHVGQALPVSCRAGYSSHIPIHRGEPRPFRLLRRSRISLVLTWWQTRQIFMLILVSSKKKKKLTKFH